MNKIFYLITCHLLLVTLLSCEKEGTLEPSNIHEDYFTISPDASDPVSVMRREFFERNGVHLLFNDTLCHEQRGYNRDGSPYWFTEIIDPAYGLTTSNTRNYEYEYLPDEAAMQSGIDFTETYLLPRLGKKLRPYSILIVQKVSYLKETYDGQWYSNVPRVEPTYYNGSRCFVINMNKIGDTEAKRNTNCQKIFRDIINAKIGLLDANVMDEFYSISGAYHSKKLADFGLPYYPTIEELYPYGFIDPYYKYTYGWFSSKALDLSSFLTAFFANSEEEYRAKYGEYPLLIQKFEVMKKIASDMGFAF